MGIGPKSFPQANRKNTRSLKWTTTFSSSERWKSFCRRKKPSRSRKVKTMKKTAKMKPSQPNIQTFSKAQCWRNREKRNATEMKIQTWMVVRTVKIWTTKKVKKKVKKKTTMVKRNPKANASSSTSVQPSAVKSQVKKKKKMMKMQPIQCNPKSNRASNRGKNVSNRESKTWKTKPSDPNPGNWPE